MLKFLRNKKVQKNIYLALAILIIPPFVIWGVFMDQSEKSSALGSIGPKQISIQQYLASYKAVQHQLMLLYGPQFESLKSLVNFKGEAWDRILLLDYAKRERIHTRDEEVVDWLSMQPLFSNRDRFDVSFYKRYVNNALRTNTRDFEEEVRQILTIAKIRERLRSRIHFSDSELKDLYAKAHPEGVDEKKFDEEKEKFRQAKVDEKTAKEMRSLIEKLRGSLKVDVETMKQIFGAEEIESEKQVSSRATEPLDSARGKLREKVEGSK